MKITKASLADFLILIRGAQRPWIVYLFATIFGGLTIYAFIKYGNESLALAIVTGFTGVVGTIIGFLFGERKDKTNEEIK